MARLLGSDLAQEIPADLLQQLQRAGRLVTYEAGVLLHQHGDPVDCITLIRRGQVRFFKLDREGRKLTTTELGQGAFYGLAPLLAELPRSHHAETSSETELLRIEAVAFLEMLQNNPQLGQLLLKHIASRYLQSLDLLDQVQRLPLRNRLANLLVNLAEVATVRMTQQQLAEELGVSRNAVGQVIKQFSAAGQIEVVYGGVRVLQPEALKGLALAGASPPGRQGGL